MPGDGVLAQKGDETDTESDDSDDDKKKDEPTKDDSKAGGDKPEDPERPGEGGKTEEPAGGKPKPSGNIEFFTKIAEFFDAKFNDILKEDKDGNISPENVKKAQEMCSNVNEWYDEAKKKLAYFDYENKEDTSMALESFCNTYVAVRASERPTGGEKPDEKPVDEVPPKGGKDEDEDKPKDEGDAKGGEKTEGDDKKPEEPPKDDDKPDKKND